MITTPTFNVAVVGKGRNCPDELAGLARRVGWEIGLLTQHNVALVTGGLGGVMHHAAHGYRGARNRQGQPETVIGLIPAGVHPDLISEWNTVNVFTGMGVHFRNVMTAFNADCMVILPGSHGTMQEMTVALDLGVPCIRVGDHTGYLTDLAPYTYIGTAVEGSVHRWCADRLRDRIALNFQRPTSQQQ